MSSDKADFLDEDSHGKPGDDHSSLSGWFWLTVLLLSGGLCLASNSVMAGAIIPAAASMQSALQAAKWIRNNDPNGNRAKACSWFLIATGCWNALATGLISLAAWAAVVIITEQPPSESQVMACIFAIAAATLATCLIGYWAAWKAWSARVRVWVHPKLHRIARYDLSNLRNQPLHPPRSNHAVFVLAISLCLPILVAGFVWMVYLAGVPVPDEEKAFANACGLASLTVGPIIGISLLVVLSSRLLAGSPAECWSDVVPREEST